MSNKITSKENSIYHPTLSERPRKSPSASISNKTSSTTKTTGVRDTFAIQRRVAQNHVESQLEPVAQKNSFLRKAYIGLAVGCAMLIANAPLAIGAAVAIGTPIFAPMVVGLGASVAVTGFLLVGAAYFIQRRQVQQLNQTLKIKSLHLEKARQQVIYEKAFNEQARLQEKSNILPSSSGSLGTSAFNATNTIQNKEPKNRIPDVDPNVDFVFHDNL